MTGIKKWICHFVLFFFAVLQKCCFDCSQLNKQTRFRTLARIQYTTSYSKASYTSHVHGSLAVGCRQWKPDSKKPASSSYYFFFESFESQYFRFDFRESFNHARQFFFAHSRYIIKYVCILLQLLKSLEILGFTMG